MLGGGDDEVSVMSVVYPCGKVSVSSLGPLSSVGSSSKPSHPSLPLSLGLHCIKEYFKKMKKKKKKKKKNRVRSENTSSHRKIRPGMRSRGRK